MTEINGINIPFVPINGFDNVSKISTIKTGNDRVSQFDELLMKEMCNLKFSKHALERMENRNLALNVSDLSKLENAVSNLEIKGAKDSLVLLDNKALIVNIPNKTIVTLLDKAGLNENVISNIDSAYIA